MESHLKDRIVRRLETLPDERAYQILDYIEFLESKYAARSNPDNLFTKLSERVEDTMRAGKLPVDAITGTVTFFDGASKVMRGLASAAQSVVDEASKVARGSSSDGAPTAVPEEGAKPPADPGAAEGTG
jgi:hypothetical protein